MKLPDRTHFLSTRNVPLWAGVMIVAIFSAMVVWMR
jgi:hypothetical protein